MFAYRIIAKNTIEEKIRLLQEKKKALANSVISEEAFSQALTIDDLEFLFSDFADTTKHSGKHSDSELVQ